MSAVHPMRVAGVGFNHETGGFASVSVGSGVFTAEQVVARVNAHDGLVSALRNLLAQVSNIEVLGEWEAQDVNRSARKTVRAKVDAVVASARRAVTDAGAVS